MFAITKDRNKLKLMHCMQLNDETKLPTCLQ